MHNRAPGPAARKIQTGITVLTCAVCVLASLYIVSSSALSGPWQPLFYLVERQIAPYAFLVMLTFGCMFASLTEWPAMVSQVGQGGLCCR